MRTYGHSQLRILQCAFPRVIARHVLSCGDATAQAICADRGSNQSATPRSLAVPEEPIFPNEPIWLLARNAVTSVPCMRYSKKPRCHNDGTIAPDVQRIAYDANPIRQARPILDDLGLPVESADVTGTFSGKFVGTLTETTDANGVAVLTIGPKNGSTDYTFCVDNVVHTTLTYDSNANVETCDVYP